MVAELAVTRMDSDRERALVERSRSDASAFGELYDFYLPRPGELTHAKDPGHFRAILLGHVEAGERTLQLAN